MENNGNLHLLLTPAQLPLLASDALRFLWGGIDTDGRYVYVYQSRFSESDDGAMLLTDIGGTGTIDEWLAISSTEWNVVEELNWKDRYSE